MKNATVSKRLALFGLFFISIQAMLPVRAADPVTAMTAASSGVILLKAVKKFVSALNTTLYCTTMPGKCVKSAAWKTLRTAGIGLIIVLAGYSIYKHPDLFIEGGKLALEGGKKAFVHGKQAAQKLIEGPEKPLLITYSTQTDQEKFETDVFQRQQESPIFEEIEQVVEKPQEQQQIIQFGGVTYETFDVSRFNRTGVLVEDIINALDNWINKRGNTITADILNRIDQLPIMNEGFFATTSRQLFAEFLNKLMPINYSDQKAAQAAFDHFGKLLMPAQ